MQCAGTWWLEGVSWIDVCWRDPEHRHWLDTRQYPESITTDKIPQNQKQKIKKYSVIVKYFLSLCNGNVQKPYFDQLKILSLPFYSTLYKGRVYKWKFCPYVCFSVRPSSLLILFLNQTLSSRNIPLSTLVTQPVPRFSRLIFDDVTR